MNPVEELFAGDPSSDVPSVGIELELLPVRYTAGERPVIASVADTSAALGDLPHVSFEPGGQVELSPPPAPTARDAVLAATSIRRDLERRLEPHGIEPVAIGLEPWHEAGEVPLQLATDRYVALDAHYCGIGPHGGAFMRQTAATQICVGMRPGADGQAQWYAANLIAPLLAAAFANAPFRHGRASGHNGARIAVCRQADPSRHSVKWVGIEPAAAYADLARQARPIGPAYAGAAGLSAHLTTLFPPVRPRSTYLELRSIDALDDHDLTAVVVLVTTLLASPAAAQATIERMTVTHAGDRARWESAAGHGIRDRWIADEVATLVDIAAGGARALPGDYLPEGAPDILARLRERVATHRAPGDERLVRFRQAHIRRAQNLGVK